MTIYGAQVNRKWPGSEPEVGRKWNARDLQAQGACALRFFITKVNLNLQIKLQVVFFPSS